MTDFLLYEEWPNEAGFNEPCITCGEPCQATRCDRCLAQMDEDRLEAECGR